MSQRHAHLALIRSQHDYPDSVHRPGFVDISTFIRSFWQTVPNVGHSSGTQMREKLAQNSQQEYLSIRVFFLRPGLGFICWPFNGASSLLAVFCFVIFGWLYQITKH